MSPEAVAEAALYWRLVNDPVLTALLGPGRRIFDAWPGDVLKKEHCPRLTYYVTGPPPLTRGIQHVRASVDIWVWPDGLQGGRPKLLAIDSRINGYFDAAKWTYQDHWIVGRAGGFRDAPGSPIRRTRDILLDVAALTAAPAP